MKTCTKCEKPFPETGEFFHIRKTRNNQLFSCCKTCYKENTKEYRKNNKEKLAVAGKNYREKNKEKETERFRKYYKENINKEHIRKKKYYTNNKSKYKEYVECNKEKIKNRTKSWLENKKIVDPNYKLGSRLRCRLNKALKNNQKSGSAIKDLGCTIDQLKDWLERQFVQGMTWDNYGKKEGQWSIDHEYPLSLVDLTDRNKLLPLIHYTNLQPMWHVDNIIKRDSF